MFVYACVSLCTLTLWFDMQNAKVQIVKITSSEVSLVCPSADVYKKSLDNPCNVSVIRSTRDGLGFTCTGCQRSVEPRVKGKVDGMLVGIGVCFLIINLTFLVSQTIPLFYVGNPLVKHMFTAWDVTVKSMIEQYIPDFVPSDISSWSPADISEIFANVCFISVNM